jgi:hypothetical protein
MTKEQLNITVDPELRDKFYATAMKKYGGKHGAKSLAATEALQEWIAKEEVEHYG